jgi:hypothetical protein
MEGHNEHTLTKILGRVFWKKIYYLTSRFLCLANYSVITVMLLKFLQVALKNTLGGEVKQLAARWELSSV